MKNNDKMSVASTVASNMYVNYTYFRTSSLTTEQEGVKFIMGAAESHNIIITMTAVIIKKRKEKYEQPVTGAVK